MSTGGLRMRQVGPEAESDVRSVQSDAFSRTRAAIRNEPLVLGWDYATVIAECETWLCDDALGPTGALILRPRPDDLFLESIATVGRAAGTGLGTKLMDFTLRRATELRLPAIRLMTDARNPAVAWYERTGFRVEEREAMPDRVVLHMVRPIAGEVGGMP